MPSLFTEVEQVKEGQEVLVKLRSYSFDWYRMICCRIKHIADVPHKESAFKSRVDFKTGKFSDLKRPGAS